MYGLRFAMCGFQFEARVLHAAFAWRVFLRPRLFFAHSGRAARFAGNSFLNGMRKACDAAGKVRLISGQFKSNFGLWKLTGDFRPFRFASLKNRLRFGVRFSLLKRLFRLNCRGNFPRFFPAATPV
ncbi:MAG: hypothetical protein DBX55_02595 [Verrucomicrobia bacterium]|nr:MAG: hypothetical protein DBX55_02595 [Verrucomicrobiota bacterium]